ncbi:ribbon-helix-helix protein, CopG family [Pseudomonadota bacterium]
MGKPYPSQIRYNIENPTITFRMKREEKNQIESLARKTGKSISQLVRENLLEVKNEYDEGYHHGHDNGYKKACEQWKIWFLCNVCGKRIYLEPNSDAHQVVIQYMREHGWTHSQCVTQ